MKIKLAKTSGFCMGVRRAVELALQAVHTRTGPIYSYGPLIHNPQAVGLLSSKGLQVLESGQENLEGIASGTVIIRAHGIPPAERRLLESIGLDIIDATCPRVIRVQAIIGKHARAGYTPVIWGNAAHPEVIGLLGFSEGRGRVVTEVEDVAQLPDLEKIILVAQTTQKKDRFHELAEAVRDRWPQALVFDTICGSTQRRQDEVRQLSRDVQAMVVVGGHSSGNTRRLAAVAEAEGVKTIHVETDDELEPPFVRGIDTIGVTAGASTPNWMIKRVIRKIERLARSNSPSFRTVAHRLLRMAILSNLYAAFGAAWLCLAGSMLQGLETKISYFLAAFFYIHAMHLLNVYMDKEANQFNDPDRVLFLEKHKGLLLGSGVLSGLFAFGLCLHLGGRVLALLIVMSTLGLLYAVPLVPHSWEKRLKFRRLKDIPVSKTLSLSGGWAVFIGLIPALSREDGLTWSTLMVVSIIFFMVFIRSAVGDIMAIQGDRIAGKETIPIMIGEEKTMKLLWVITGFQTFLLIGGHAAGLLTSLALPLVICSVYSAVNLFALQREQFLSSVFFEAFLDANFFLAGLLSWMWAWSLK